MKNDDRPNDKPIDGVVFIGRGGKEYRYSKKPAQPKPSHPPECDCWFCRMERALGLKE